MERIPLPVELRAVPQSVLEQYVTGRLKQFSRLFGLRLSPGTHEHSLEEAFSYVTSTLEDFQKQEQPEFETFFLRFVHKCRYFACAHKNCALCLHNPNKLCSVHTNFDESYADNQVLKSKCDADIYVELVSRTTGIVNNASGIELQVSVVDGESCNTPESGDFDLNRVRELLKSDDGQTLLSGTLANGQRDASGRITLILQDGMCRLPDLVVTDKTDTFRLGGQQCVSFRLMAMAVQRDAVTGSINVLSHIEPALSSKFSVKTQRAMNDFRKPDYPHYKDKVTKLKYIGGVGAERLRELHLHMPDVPYTTVVTVEQLKQLVQFTEKNRQLEGKLLDILHMMGKHKHKWEHLRSVLLEKVVYDDTLNRVWFADEELSQGLLFQCKQGQVNMDKPVCMVQHVDIGGQAKLQAVPVNDGQSADLMRIWRAGAEEAWYHPGHKGWVVLTEPLEVGGTMEASGIVSQMSLSMSGLHPDPVGFQAPWPPAMGMEKRPSMLNIGTPSAYMDVNMTQGPEGSPKHGPVRTGSTPSSNIAHTSTDFSEVANAVATSWGIMADEETPHSTASRSSSHLALGKRNSGVMDSPSLPGGHWVAGSQTSPAGAEMFFDMQQRSVSLSAPGAPPIEDLSSNSGVDFRHASGGGGSPSLMSRPPSGRSPRYSRISSDHHGSGMTGEPILSAFTNAAQGTTGYSDSVLSRLDNATKRRRPSQTSGFDNGILDQFYSGGAQMMISELKGDPDLLQNEAHVVTTGEQHSLGTSALGGSSSGPIPPVARDLSAAMWQTLHLSDEALPPCRSPDLSMAYNSETAFDLAPEANQIKRWFVANTPQEVSQDLYPFAKPTSQVEMPLQQAQAEVVAVDNRLSAFVERQYSDSFGRFLDTFDLPLNPERTSDDGRLAMLLHMQLQDPAPMSEEGQVQRICEDLSL